MIYLKNNTEKQTIFIPRNELQKEAFITTIRTYEDGLKEGYGNGIEDQKDQLLNLYVTENGTYEREDGYGKVTVVIEGGTDCKEAIEDAYENGYNEGYEQGKAEGGGECNLEDKIICPQTNEVDGNGYIYIRPNEGYDGLMEVALQTADLKNGWYSEGYEQGKSEGGECNLEEIINTPQISDVNEGYLYYNPSEGYNGLSRVVIHTGDLRNTWYNEGYNEGVEQGGGGSELVLGHNLEVIETNGRHIFYPQNNGWNGFDLFEVEVDVPTTAKLQDVWVEPTMADVDGNNLLVYAPNTDEGYDGLSRVVVNPKNIYNEGYNEGKKNIGSYYPIMVEDVSFGEWAKDFKIYPNSLFYKEEDYYLNTDEITYLPTDANKNIVLTSKPVTDIIGLPFDSADYQYISLIKIGSGVERVNIGGVIMSNITTIVMGEDMYEFTSMDSAYPKLHTIIARGIINLDFNYSEVADNGTLWVNENNQYKENLLAQLPNGWELKIITDEMNILL